MEKIINDKQKRYILIFLVIIILISSIFSFNQHVKAMGIATISAATLAKFILLSAAATIGIYSVKSGDYDLFIDDFLNGSKYIKDEFIVPFTTFIYSKLTGIEISLEYNNYVQDMLNDFTMYASMNFIKVADFNFYTYKNDDDYFNIRDDIYLKDYPFGYHRLYLEDLRDVYAYYDYANSFPHTTIIDGQVLYNQIPNQNDIFNFQFASTLGKSIPIIIKNLGDNIYSFKSIYGIRNFEYFNNRYSRVDVSYFLTSDKFLVTALTYGYHHYELKTSKSFNDLKNSENTLVLDSVDFQPYLDDYWGEKAISYQEAFPYYSLALNQEKMGYYNRESNVLLPPVSVTMPIVGVVPDDLGKSISHDGSLPLSKVIQGAVVSDSYLARVQEVSRGVKTDNLPLPLFYPKSISHQSAIEAISQATSPAAMATATSAISVATTSTAVGTYTSAISTMPVANVCPTLPPFTLDLDFEQGTESIDWGIWRNLDVPKKFPFSIPWDIYKIISVLSVGAEKPVFNFAMQDYKFSLDFGEFEEFAIVSRFFISLIWVGVLYTSFKRYKGD